MSLFWVLFFVLAVVAIGFVIWISPMQYGDGVKRNYEPPFPLPKSKDDQSWR